MIFLRMMTLLCFALLYSRPQNLPPHTRLVGAERRRQEHEGLAQGRAALLPDRCAVDQDLRLAAGGEVPEGRGDHPEGRGGLHLLHHQDGQRRLQEHRQWAARRRASHGE